MNEATAKALILTHVRRASGRRLPTVTAELTLGMSSVRADLVVVRDSELIGIEIKTERDTLRRLPAQIKGYAKFFHHAMIVADERHLAAILNMDVRGASVWVLEENGIELVSKGQRNVPCSSVFGEMMTREERRVFDAGGREAYLEVFTKRYGESSQTFWDSVRGRKIRSEDIKFLSRFTERRLAILDIARDKELQWQRWREAYAQQPSVVCS